MVLKGPWQPIFPTGISHHWCLCILGLSPTSLPWVESQVLPSLQAFFKHTQSFRFSSVTQSCPTLCNPMDCSTPGFPVHHQLLESVIPSIHLILCHPLLLPPSIFPSIRVFSNESVLRTRWPKYWSFSFNISPSNEYSGLSSFRMDWLDLLAVQGTLKSLLQHHSSKASAFFIVHFSHPYMTTGKTIALTRRTFVGKVMSLFLICCLCWS